MKGTLLTFIVPAYHFEKYVGDCLHSLVNQSLMNHRIVIVNDGSTDNTEEVCIQYREKYPELITYIRQENQGLGEARNVGMKNADTPYIAFLDSDDWLNTKYVERFSELVENADERPDLVFTLPWIYNSVTHHVDPWMDRDLLNRIFEVRDHGDSRVQTNTRIHPDLYALEVNACRKIYRTAFLKERNFTFPKGLKWEDVPGHFYLLHEANTCMALPEVGFFYRVNQGGTITSGGGASRLDMIPIFKQLLDVQEKSDFNRTERKYVLRLIINFSRWSVDVTNQNYIKKLLEGLHEVYQTFDEEILSAYLESISPDRYYETGFVKCIQSDEYEKLGDYLVRNQVIDQFARMADEANKKHNIVLGGVQCMCDHGVSYTMLLALRKVARRLGFRAS